MVLEEYLTIGFLHHIFLLAIVYQYKWFQFEVVTYSLWCHSRFCYVTTIIFDLYQSSELCNQNNSEIRMNKEVNQNFKNVSLKLKLNWKKDFTLLTQRNILVSEYLRIYEKLKWKQRISAIIVKLNRKNGILSKSRQFKT